MMTNNTEGTGVSTTRKTSPPGDCGGRSNVWSRCRQEVLRMHGRWFKRSNAETKLSVDEEEEEEEGDATVATKTTQRKRRRRRRRNRRKNRERLRGEVVVDERRRNKQGWDGKEGTKTHREGREACVEGGRIGR